MRQQIKLATGQQPFPPLTDVREAPAAIRMVRARVKRQMSEAALAHLARIREGVAKRIKSAIKAIFGSRMVPTTGETLPMRPGALKRDLWEMFWRI